MRPTGCREVKFCPTIACVAARTTPGCSRPFGARPRASSRSSTVDRVAEELRRALFDGEVEPGTPLREVALAEAMGVSRSTVREALGVLVAEGLATREPNRGVHVAELDPDSVHDVCRGPRGARGRRRAPLADGAGSRPGTAVRTALRDVRRRSPRRPRPAELTARPPGDPPLVRRPDRVAAAGRAGRDADRRDPARAGQGRPDPAQRRRPGALPRDLSWTCSRRATSTPPPPSWRTTWRTPRRRC